MTGNPSQSKHALTPALISLSLIILLWALVQGAGPGVEPLQTSAHTRAYLAETPEGLSLHLDLRMPNPPLVSATADQATGLAFSQPHTYVEPEEQSSEWPYYLLGILLLGGSAVWLLRQRDGRALPALEEKAELPEPASAFFLGGHDEPETASSEEGFEVSIELLRQHIGENPAESVVPWLLLLDLLHRKGNASEYEQARKECKKHFNVDMPPYKKIKTAPKKQGIESYPHIMSKLIRLWPSEEASSYLNALLHDSRDGSRAGFDLTTYHDIATLRAVLETESL